MNNILLLFIAILVVIGGLAFLYLKRKERIKSTEGPKGPEEPGTPPETPAV